VTALVEWPAIYACHFDEEFLEAPSECLVLTMQTNQKYFALMTQEGQLSNRFLIVSNIETQHPQHIISGNEKVIRPRLADARFFFTQDKKRTLESRIPELVKVIYHNQLGNQLQRMERVRNIAEELSGQLNKSGFHIQNKDIRRAAEIAKTDLLTDMVGEFPELQGNERPSMVAVTLPDGSRREFPAPLRVADVAQNIGSGLAKAALAGSVDGQLVDLSYLIERDVALAIITDKNPEGLDIIRHSTAHLLAYAVKELFPEAQVTIGPVIENGFYYDFSYHRPFTPDDLTAIEKRMAELAKQDEELYRNKCCSARYFWCFATIFNIFKKITYKSITYKFNFLINITQCPLISQFSKPILTQKSPYQPVLAPF
jgi:hypothetical protein